MTTFLAANLTLALFVLIVGLLQRSHHRAAGMPHGPFGLRGSDAHDDADLDRVLHDLGARGR